MAWTSKEVAAMVLDRLSPAEKRDVFQIFEKLVNNSNVSSAVTMNEVLCNFSQVSTLMHEMTRQPLLPKQWLMLFFVLYMVVFLFGITGNLLTIFVIVKTTNLHSHTNIFLCNLAISDSLMILLGVPNDLLYIAYPYMSPGGNFYCWIKSLLIMTYTNCSILTITALTVERYIAICYPLHLRSYFDRERVIKIIYLVWICAVIPAILMAMQFRPIRTMPLCKYGLATETCDFAPKDGSILKYSFELCLLVNFVLPLLLICFLDWRIVVVLRECSGGGRLSSSSSVGSQGGQGSAQTANGGGAGSAPAQQIHSPVVVSASVASDSALLMHCHSYRIPRSVQAQGMVMKMLAVVTGVFVACYLPFHIQRLLTTTADCRTQKTLCDFLHAYWPVCGLLHYSSATLNPLFYNLMSVRFRTAFHYWCHHLCSGTIWRTHRYKLAVVN